MCLYVKDKTPKIAQEPIIGYKVLRRTLATHYVNGEQEIREEFITPNQNKIVKFGEPILVNSSKPIWHSCIKDMYLIEGHGSHMFKTREAAETYIKEMDSPRESYRPYEYVIVYGVIPKGAEYWENDTGYPLFIRIYEDYDIKVVELPAIASKEITYYKELPND